jgi:hypothetical protein
MLSGFDFPKLSARGEPFTHAVCEDFLPPTLYSGLRAAFPVCPPLGGPTGFSYFRGDKDYDDLIAGNAAWREFVGKLQSQDLVDYCVALFADAYRADGCLIDTGQARYVNYFESRSDKARRHIEAVTLRPEELWVRVDILQGRTGYWREAHLDHRRRLVTMLIYFCDAAENGMEGGSLVLHQSRDRHVPQHDPEFAPRHNLMVAFPCTAKSFHSVTRITRQNAPRNFVQITVSSSVDAWPSG